MRDINNKNVAVLCDTVGKVQAMINILKYKDCEITSAERYEKYGKNTCQSMRTRWCGDTLCFGSKIFYESEGYEIITFDEFMEESEYSAEEILGWLIKNNKNGKYANVFGADYLFDDLIEMFTPSEIVYLVSAQLDKEKLTTISKSSYDKIATEQLDKLYPNGWKVEE